MGVQGCALPIPLWGKASSYPLRGYVCSNGGKKVVMLKRCLTPCTTLRTPYRGNVGKKMVCGNRGMGSAQTITPCTATQPCTTCTATQPCTTCTTEGGTGLRSSTGDIRHALYVYFAILWSILQTILYTLSCPRVVRVCSSNGLAVPYCTAHYPYPRRR